MTLITQPPRSLQQPGTPKSIWYAPASPWRWRWLVSSVLLIGVVSIIYLITIKTQAFVGPFSDPLRSFGILSFLLLLSTAAYSLRRRFIRGLPGKVQNWLWMHTWAGITALVIALFHENFTHILHEYCNNASCLTQAYGGSSALLALLILVLSGLAGRLIDSWQARAIASDARNNGTGIVKALEERLLELEYTIERLSAGKSETFKHYCMQAIEQKSLPVHPDQVPQNELPDWHLANDTLRIYARLAQSLHQQQHARNVIRLWRRIHSGIAILSLLVITFHASMELLTNVFHLVSSR